MAAFRTTPPEMVALYLRMLSALGRALPARARVLDVGCGEGASVAEFEQDGHDAFRCDIVVAEPTDRIRRIQEPYRLPFEDASFDFVSSDQVLEHVQDHATAFREIDAARFVERTYLETTGARGRLLRLGESVPPGLYRNFRGRMLFTARRGGASVQPRP